MDTKPVFLGGQWLTLEHAYAIINPATEVEIARVGDCGYDEALRALDLAAAALADWRRTPPKARADVLLGAYQGMRREADALARIVTAENGKPLAEARREIEFSAEYLRWFAEEARRATGQTVPSPQPGRRFFTTLEPVGVVGMITPWNFPANMITRKCAPALAAGCTAVLKPSPETPLTALEIARLFEQAGLPRGVLSVLPSNRAAEISQAFYDHPAVRMISFTGSTAVGRMLMERAAGGIKRVGLELGGNAPVIVFEDADLELAVREAVALKFLRVGGESCICANRIFVQDSIYDEFRARFWQALLELKLGDGMEPGVQLGPLITARARERVSALVADAVAHGGVLSQAPCNAARGFFFAPTLIEGANESMQLAHEEIFAPVAPLYRFANEAEAIRRANNVPYGLAAYLFTENLSRALRVGERLEAGLVGINDGGGYVPEIPMGGYKQSGIGREGGAEGLREYMEVKSWVIGTREPS